MNSPTHAGSTWSNAAEDQVVLLAPDPQWPQRFAAEAEAIRSALPSGLKYELEHVGSTAVPNLSAKPIIDILLICDEIARWPELIAPLEALGYAYWDGNPRRDRLFLVKGMPPFGTGRTHHVHVRTHADAVFTLRFRDALRANPVEARRYEALKRELAAQHPTDREAYTRGKSAYIEGVLAQTAGQPTPNP